MSFEQINAHCYYYNSAVNIGYVHDGETGLMIDTGIDPSSVKKMLKELKKRELPLTHLFITHAHADHYGGAAYIQEQFNLKTITPVFEEAILQNPLLEPLYLFGGNDPLPELQNKFLQGPKMHVDQAVTEGTLQIGSLHVETYLLPGHSYHQLALLTKGVLFAADSYFSESQLRNHKIPYVTDTDATLKSLDRLLNIPCDGALPGHGLYEENFKDTVKANIHYHNELLQWMEAYLQNYPEGVSHEQMVSAMCSYYSVNVQQFSQWLLFKTAVTAYLVALKKQDRVNDKIDEYRWMFFPFNKA
ncbi:MBL fold metallo-hydrolase [Halobacillus shinanisalinarum]|uniref:MBL fold metallo-hydrolase n=1 Tax=Halobacillus shinanisalinarum TaxID=2932258 RepID=A0ABY4GXP5_9BACI|nr:MBL fold metallo-hydrolase [Halobacillus shinanisalinarum]UOQ92858.1 MBL fold metallo-hydrolase [Halobacillus shinanisalinarum]